MPAKKPIPPACPVGPDDRLLSRTQAARVCGLAPSTLRDMACRRAGPPFVKRGSAMQARCYYPESALREWIAASARVVG